MKEHLKPPEAGKGQEQNTERTHLAIPLIVHSDCRKVSHYFKSLVRILLCSHRKLVYHESKGKFQSNESMHTAEKNWLDVNEPVLWGKFISIMPILEVEKSFKSTLRASVLRNHREN